MMFGMTEHEMARERMRLMGAFGGCGLSIDSVGLAMDAAFCSLWVTPSKMVLGFAARAGLEQLGLAHEREAQQASARSRGR